METFEACDGVREMIVSLRAVCGVGFVFQHDRAAC